MRHGEADREVDQPDEDLDAERLRGMFEMKTIVSADIERAARPTITETSHVQTCELPGCDTLT